MMDENEFWVRQIKTLVTGFCILVVAGMGSCQATRYQVRMAIEAGAEPLAAECAITDVHCDVLEAAEAERTRNE